MEQQYLPKIPVPVQHMAIYYHLVAELELDVFKLKLPIRSMHRRNQQADVSGENG